MEAIEIRINLPEGVASEAAAHGLLTPDGIESLLLAEMERIARTEEVKAIRYGMEEFDRGEGRPAREALEELRLKHGISR